MTGADTERKRRFDQLFEAWSPNIVAYCGWRAASDAATLDVEDPYYGTHDDFEDVFTVIDAALPGLHEWVDEQLADRGIAS